MLMKANHDHSPNDWSFLVCDCGDISHQLAIQKIDSGEVIVSIHLTQFPFWKRLWNGIKYIFGHRSRYGDFDEFILGYWHSQALQEVVDELKKKVFDNG